MFCLIDFSCWSQWGNLLGSDAEEVAEGFELAQDVPFSIDVVEQGHAIGAILARDHNYGCPTLAARMGLGQVRPLCTPSVLERKLSQLDKRISTLADYNANRITARHVFVQQQMRKEVPKGRGDPLENQQRSRDVMAAHSELFKALDIEERLMLDGARDKMRQERKKTNQDTMDKYEEEKRQLTNAAQATLEDQGIKNHVAAAKFNSEDIKALCEDIAAPKIAKSTIRDCRDWYAAPDEPEAIEREVFEAIEKELTPEKPPVPWWCNAIAGNGDLWRRVAIRATSFPRDQWLLVLFTWNLRKVTFLELRRRARRVTVGSASSSADAWEPQRRVMEWECLPGLKFHHSEDVLIPDADDIQVVTDVRFGRDCVYSCHAPENFEHFTAGHVHPNWI